MAEVKLPGIFGSGMVLQQGMPVKVWGVASPGESVSVSFAADTGRTSADAKGEWKLELPAQKASATPARLIVKGTNEIVLDNVLVGEVWLCSGQSNMAMGIQATDHAEAEIAAADNPELRLFFIKQPGAAASPDDVAPRWKACSPLTVIEDGERHNGWPLWKGFSGVGYHFGKVLSRELKVPVGLIQAAVGGSGIDSWQISTWSFGVPGGLANGMLRPIVPFQIRGAIWYQGEANHLEGVRYVDKTRDLLAGWRNAWAEPELPCYIVQLAPFKYRGESAFVLPEFWEAQLAITNSIPNTGIASTIDLGDPDDIHPKRKKEVGARLALQALQKTYGRTDLVADGPAFKSLSIKGSKLTVSFDHVPAGLKSSDGMKLNSFELLDANTGGFVVADAAIDGKTVILSASQVAKPVAVRFAWSNVASPNLVSSDGLPAYPFRAAEPNAMRLFRALSGVPAPVR
ncbi:MAG: sialate O-acetylesterase [Verrucomicrobiota bacterium]